MAKQTRTLPAQVQEALDVLAENLVQSEPMLAYRHAEARLNASQAARGLIENLTIAQKELRADYSRDGAEKARALQAQVQSNRIIMDWIEAQQAANAYLGDVNLEISALLGVDFAALAKAGSC